MHLLYNPETEFISVPQNPELAYMLTPAPKSKTEALVCKLPGETGYSPGCPHTGQQTEKLKR